MPYQKTILFVCTHNSARSQMAEGMVNYFFGEKYNAKSAGTEKTNVHPMAIQVLAELGIDISHHQSKTVDNFIDQQFDVVITVCDNAKETCPYFPHTNNQIHVGFEDPSAMKGSKEERLSKFREIRDEIREWLQNEFSKEF